MPFWELSDARGTSHPLILLYPPCASCSSCSSCSCREVMDSFGSEYGILTCRIVIRMDVDEPAQDAAIRRRAPLRHPETAQVGRESRCRAGCFSTGRGECGERRGMFLFSVGRIRSIDKLIDIKPAGSPIFAMLGEYPKNSRRLTLLENFNIRPFRLLLLLRSLRESWKVYQIRLYLLVCT